MDVILKLLGVYRERAGTIQGVHPTYHNDVPLWLVLLASALLIGLTFWLYRRTAEYVTPARRYTLATLRAAFLCLLLVLVLHPVLSITVAGAVRQTVVVLADTSESMGVSDTRTDEADQKRAAIARGELDPAGGLKQEFKGKAEDKTPRLELARAALKNPKLDLVNRLESKYELAPFTFDRTVKEVAQAAPPLKEESKTAQVAVSFTLVAAVLAILAGVLLAAFKKPRTLGVAVGGAGVAVFAAALVLLMYLDRAGSAAPAVATTLAGDRHKWIDEALKSADGPATALGDAVRDTIYRKRGQALAGLVLITDGGNNAGSNPMKAAELAKAEGLPLYIYGVGITSPRDIIVSNVFVQDVTFVRDEVPVTVRVQAQGLKGQVGKLVLRLGEKEVDSKEVSFDEDEQNVNLKFNPQDVGDFDLTASIEARKDEVEAKNNAATKHVRVVDGRIKVLHIEQLPRWDFKYLQAMLLRDRRVDYKCVLLEADAAVTEIPNSPYLKAIPTRVGELAAFDLIVIGDVDPKRLSPVFMEALGDFVARAGGSVLMVAGKKFSPLAYRKTPIEKMLPVEFDTPSAESLRNPSSDKAIRVELTEQGKTSSMLRLADKEPESTQRWGQLPAIYWDARVARAKPAAEVLVVDGDPTKASRYGKMPIIALQQYGLGQVLYVGTDNTWRWRKNAFEQDFTRLWSQMVERMALPHMLGASKRTQLNTDRQNYAAGDRVTVFARLYKEKDFEPVTEPTVKALFKSKDAGAAASDGAHEVLLRSLPDQPGMYRAEFVAPKPGAYRFSVESDAATTLDFVVTNQTLELAQTAMNERLLRELAAQTGGQFYREEDLIALPDNIQRTGQPKLSSFEVEFAFSPLYFMLLLGVVTAEWIIRKLCQLK